MQARYRHRFIDCFAHIVNREGGNAHSRKRFHFDSRLCQSRDLAPDSDAVVADLEVDLDMLDRKRVTKRNQFIRALDRLDRRNPRRRQDVSFCNLIRPNPGDGFWLKRYDGFSRGDPPGERFAGDVDHFCGSIFRNVR